MSRAAQHDSAEEEGPECCQEDFLNDVAAVIPSAWYKFGLCLGIDNEKLKAIEVQKHCDQLLCFVDVYSIWRKESCKPVTWTVVVEILKGNMLKNESLARQLKRKYCDT